jgi:ClpP class serine protease
MTLCAHLSAALGEAGHANTLRALLVPYADVASALGGVFSGVTGYYLGLLDELVGEWDRAAETFGRAADLHRVGGAPRWHVRSELGRLRSLSHLAGISGEQISALAARVRADASRLGMTAAAVEASTFL